MARPPLMELFQFWKVACASSPRQMVIYAVNSSLRVTVQSFQAPENLPGGASSWPSPQWALPPASPSPSAPWPWPPSGHRLQLCPLRLSPPARGRGDTFCRVFSRSWIPLSP